MFIDYTATRETVGSGLDELDFDAEQINRSAVEITTESVSMSGAGREVLLDRLEHKWAVTTVPITVDDLPRWREFAASVVAGSLFTIDLFGSKATPDDPISVSYIKSSYKENRFSKLYITFSFEVIER